MHRIQRLRPRYFLATGTLAALSALGVAACSASDSSEHSAAIEQAAGTCAVPSDSALMVPGATAPSCASANYRLTSNISYAPGAGHLLDLYVPSSGTGPFPTVIWVHGGGWRSGSKLNVNQALRLVCRGYAVASIDYRLSSVAKYPAQIFDVKAAIRHLRANAAGLGLNPDKFALFGSSAGGHLVSIAGASNGVASLEDLSMGNSGVSSRVQAVVDWYGPTRFSTMDSELAAQGCGTTQHGQATSAEGQLIGCAPSLASCADEVAAASPMTYVDANDPPFLIMRGTSDCVSPHAQSVALRDALLGAGVCTQFRTVQGAGHGGPGWDSVEAQDHVGDYLDAVFSAAPGPTPPQVNCAGLTVTGDPKATGGATWVYQSTDAGVPYRLDGVLLAPQTGTGPFPGIVVSHGRNGRPVDMANQVGKTFRTWGLTVILPTLTHALGDTVANTPDGDIGASDANVARAHKARDLLSCLNVDLARVAAHGHSMGAYATGQLLGKHPNDFLVASHTAGGVNQGVAGTKADVAALIRTPYQIHHAPGDKTVLLSFGQALVDILDSNGVSHEFYTDYSYPPDPLNPNRDTNHIEIAREPRMLERVRAWYTSAGLIP